MRRLILVISTALFVSLLFTTCISADIPHLIRFQGKVTDKQGAPLNGAYNITFRIYNSEAGGTLLWSETQSTVPVNNGIFTVLLGNVSALNLPFDQPYWLSMEINEDGEMLPRQAITSSAYALYAEKAKTIDDVSVVPQGAVIIWLGDSCPDGYNRVTALDRKFIVGDQTYNPAAGGSNTHNHGGNTGTHTLTVSEMPSHRHRLASGGNKVVDAGGFGYWDALSGVGAPLGAAAGGVNGWYDTDAAGNQLVENTGGGGGHTHSISIADSRPEFATVIFCQKD